jgi:hypothetical protein
VAPELHSNTGTVPGAKATPKTVNPTDGRSATQETGCYELIKKSIFHSLKQ